MEKGFEQMYNIHTAYPETSWSNLLLWMNHWGEREREREHAYLLVSFIGALLVIDKSF